PQFVSLLGDVAKEGVRAQPTAFVTYVPVLATRNLLGSPAGWTPVSAETPEVNAYLETPPVLPFGAATLRWRWTLEGVQSAIWPTLIGLAVLGVVATLIGPRSGLLIAMAWIPVGYLLATAGLELNSPRYHVPVTGLVMALSVIGLHRSATMIGGMAVGPGRSKARAVWPSIRERIRTLAALAP